MIEMPSEKADPKKSYFNLFQTFHLGVEIPSGKVKMRAFAIYHSLFLMTTGGYLFEALQRELTGEHLYNLFYR